MASIEEARAAKRAIQSLLESRVNGEGITVENDDYAVVIMLEEPPDYPLPTMVNGVRVTTEVVGIIRPQSTCGTYPGRPWYLNQDQWESIACSCVLPSGHEGKHRCKDESHGEW